MILLQLPSGERFNVERTAPGTLYFWNKKLGFGVLNMKEYLKYTTPQIIR